MNATTWLGTAPGIGHLTIRDDFSLHSTNFPADEETANCGYCIDAILGEIVMRLSPPTELIAKLVGWRIDWAIAYIKASRGYVGG
jgi:hypothetical protein